ncbi:MAG: prepilin-type N-terminal cleavage/methylation domain-containing protein [Patescibacteria group bacterium]
MKKHNKGFTLVELLVVIAIIGVLSSVVLASLNTARQKSRDARRVADVKQVQLALELYFDATRTYPVALDVASLVTPGYISAIPVDPIDNTGYPYDQLTSGSSYEMCANLEQSTMSVLSSDIDTATALGNVTSGADATSCVAAAGRYAYNVKP